MVALTMSMGAVAAGPAATAQAADTTDTAEMVVSVSNRLRLLSGPTAPISPCVPATVTIPPGYEPPSVLDVTYADGGGSITTGGEWVTLEPSVMYSYCIFPAKDTDTITLTMQASSGEVTTEFTSPPIELDLTPESSVDAVVSEMLVAQRLLSSQALELEICARLGDIYPSNQLFHGTEADITAVCLETDATLRRTRWLQVLGTIGVTTTAATIASSYWELRNGRPDTPAPGPDPDPVPVPDHGPDPTQGPFRRELEVAQLVDRIQKQATLTNGDAQTAAYRCLNMQERLLALPGYTGSDTPCLSYALYFPGVETGEVAIHDLEAISSNPELALLTYMSSEDKADSGVQHNWYQKKPYNKICKKDQDLHGGQCDEYPYYTTVEGGPSPKVSLKVVRSHFNSMEGNARKRMIYDRYCVMGADATGAKTHPGSEITKFMVIPLATEITHPVKKQVLAEYAGPPSFHICGDPRTIEPLPGDWGGGIS